MEKEDVLLKHPYFISEGTTKVRVNLMDVSYVQAQNKMCVLYNRGKQDYILTLGLGELEKQLPTEMFLRISRGYIINIWHVMSIKGRVFVMVDGKELKRDAAYDDVVEQRLAEMTLRGSLLQ